MPGEPSVISQIQVDSPAGKLHGIAATPAGPPRARLLIIHGYGDHAGRYSHFMQWLAARGIASEAIDLRGHGQSPGRRGFVGRWDEYLEDVEAFLDRPRLESTAPNPPLFILGHSHGGLVAAIAGERKLFQKRNVVGCILSSPYFATRVVTPWYKRFVGRIANTLMPHLPVATGLRPQWLSADETMRQEDVADPLMNRIATPRWYFATLSIQAEAMSNAGLFTLPLLCVVGADDVIADPDAVADFFRWAGSVDKLHKVYPTGAHELFRDGAREAVFKQVLQWIEARLAM